MAATSLQFIPVGWEGFLSLNGILMGLAVLAVMIITLWLWSNYYRLVGRYQKAESFLDNLFLEVGVQELAAPRTYCQGHLRSLSATSATLVLKRPPFENGGLLEVRFRGNPREAMGDCPLKGHVIRRRRMAGSEDTWLLSLKLTQAPRDAWQKIASAL